MIIKKDELHALLVRLYSGAGVLISYRNTREAIEATAMEVFVHGHTPEQEEDVQLLRELVEADWDSDLRIIQ
jgi:hypothetical protein